jgi:hypothetical protein
MLLLSIVLAIAFPLALSNPTTRNCPPTPLKLEGKIMPPRSVYVVANNEAVPPPAGTLKISPLSLVAVASVTRKPPEAVCVMVSGVTMPVANWVVAAEPAVASSAEASTPTTNNFESRSLISLPSEELCTRPRTTGEGRAPKMLTATQQTLAAARTARGHRATREPSGKQVNTPPGPIPRRCHMSGTAQYP